MLSVYQIDWFAPINEGLWDNAGRISIHLPHFKKIFNIEHNLHNLKHSFFVSYNNDLCIEPMVFEYIALNDIVFKTRVFQSGRRASVFTVQPLKNIYCED